MKIKNYSIFRIRGLNQERFLNQLSKEVAIFDINRISKQEALFKCSYFKRKIVEKRLKDGGIDYSLESQGIWPQMTKFLSSYGKISAFVVFVLLYIFQYQYILRYEVDGLHTLDKAEVVCFLKENFSRTKMHIKTNEIEVELINNFKEISFASCIIRGQTLILNIKEKLMPEQIYGDFCPIISKKSGKIKEINLISGTPLVKAGDLVKEGEILVEPYMIDTSGQIKQVEANAEIVAEVYYEGSVDHYENYIEVTRTGQRVEENEIKLFGLKIYEFKEEVSFSMYEVEYEELDLSENLFLPFKMLKRVYYELEEKHISSDFESVKEKFVEKAKQKALENCKNYDKIIEEFYTLRHLSGVTIVNYCVICAEQIGGYK